MIPESKPESKMIPRQTTKISVLPQEFKDSLESVVSFGLKEEKLVDGEAESFQSLIRS